MTVALPERRSGRTIRTPTKPGDEAEPAASARAKPKQAVKVKKVPTAAKASATIVGAMLAAAAVTSPSNSPSLLPPKLIVPAEVTELQRGELHMDVRNVKEATLRLEVSLMRDAGWKEGKQIAKELGIATKTVSNVLRNVKDKGKTTDDVREELRAAIASADAKAEKRERWRVHRLIGFWMITTSFRR